MATNVSVQYNGGFLPDIILFILSRAVLLPSGNPIESLEQFLTLQPMFPQVLTKSHPDWVDARKISMDSDLFSKYLGVLGRRVGYGVGS